PGEIPASPGQDAGESTGCEVLKIALNQQKSPPVRAFLLIGQLVSVLILPLFMARSVLCSRTNRMFARIPVRVIDYNYQEKEEHT
ncbi:MAG: hypothetical protein ACPHWU_08100, partial [Marinobacter vinifirmus]